MNRKEFLNKIYAQIPVNKITVRPLKEIAEIVTTYTRTNKTFMSNIKTIEVVDGVLYFDGNIVARICEKDVKTYSNEAHYWEGRILERQERAYY